ncbi:MAG: hypothetical protein VX278_04645, partial [Myxococcota bacterium]|nr:hypothetical protein [Myxococcota bacterium]
MMTKPNSTQKNSMCVFLLGFMALFLLQGCGPKAKGTKRYNKRVLQEEYQAKKEGSPTALANFLLLHPTQEFYAEGLQLVFQATKTLECSDYSAPCLAEKKTLKALCQRFSAQQEPIAQECNTIDGYHERYAGVIAQFNDLKQAPLAPDFIAFLQSHPTAHFYEEGVGHIKTPLLEKIGDLRYVKTRLPDKRDKLNKDECASAVQTFIHENMQLADLQAYLDISENFEKIPAIQQTLSFIKEKYPEDFAAFQTKLMDDLNGKIQNAKPNAYEAYDANYLKEPVLCYRTLKTLNNLLSPERQTQVKQAIQNFLQTEVKEHCSKFSYRRDVTCYRDEVDYENVFRTIYFYQSDIAPKLFKKHKNQCMRALNACMKSAGYGKWPDEA